MNYSQQDKRFYNSICWLFPQDGSTLAVWLDSLESF